MISKYPVLKVAHYEKSTELLGPYIRFAIWVHGCCFNCDGCLVHGNKYGSYDEMSVEQLVDEIVDSDCEGVTISGGEPFLQSIALAGLVTELKNKKDIGIIVYSGFTLEELKKKKEVQQFLNSIDILIDGKYVKELDDGRAYVGSTNQRIIYLSDRYRQAGKEYYICDKKRQVEIKIYRKKLVLIGVPSDKQLKVWNDLKAKNGVTEIE